ncbi:radical SAM protein [Candidatus Gottesmanbacteria bacterium]|nr:radical SAM protein [Candidatus Gottesmanbacteria bacterium]
MQAPTSAIIAITLNCNSRCIMCDIWKNKIPNELPAEYYKKLPSSLKDINITGGEPFLRQDIVEIVRNMREAAPNARFIMNTNGFMPHMVKKHLPKILEIDPNFAFRVSIDGIGEAHDAIRRIPGGYKKILESLRIAKEVGAKDLGIAFTLIDQNVDELPKVQKLADDLGVEFSMTVATNSVIYFGSGKENLRPKNPERLEFRLKEAAKIHLTRMSPKELMRGWFIKRLISFVQTGKRALVCDAGTGFFYMDSLGSVYTCHLKPWKMGNIKTQSMETILANQTYAKRVASCDACWMVCTAKSMMRKKIFRVALEAFKDKAAIHFPLPDKPDFGVVVPTKSS